MITPESDIEVVLEVGELVQIKLNGGMWAEEERSILTLPIKVCAHQAFSERERQETE